MSQKTILICYATRQIDSNLFMSSTIFNGLYKCGFDVDMLFVGYPSICEVFENRYAKYFRNVHYVYIKESFFKKLCDKNYKLKLLYTFYLHFFKDVYLRPYSINKIRRLITNKYDTILSFVPPPISGFLGRDVKKYVLPNTRLIQYWTDPLSLGRCNDINEIPKTRFLHKKLENQIIGFADKAVFCYPLLYEMEAKLHPQYSYKMTWSDVSFVDRENIETIKSDKQIRFGHFGAYQKKIRNIDPLLSIINRFPEIKFIIRGDADFIIPKEKYSNLDIEYGRKPVSEIESLEDMCDVLIVLGGTSGITHPAGKLFYYANLKKPIIYIGEGVHDEYFKRYIKPFNRYIICQNTPESINAGINEALNSLPSFSLNIVERLLPEVIAKKIIE